MISILLAAMVASSQPSAGAAASEALVERFVAVLPPSRSDRSAPGAFEQSEEARIRSLNAGEERRLEPILSAFRQCSAAASRDLALRSVRETARRLGDEKLSRLIHFYGGPDHARFSGLFRREEAQAPLSADDSAEMERLLSAYPLKEFAEASTAVGAEMFSDSYAVERFEHCLTQRSTALTAAGLRE